MLTLYKKFTRILNISFHQKNKIDIIMKQTDTYPDVKKV